MLLSLGSYHHLWIVQFYFRVLNQPVCSWPLMTDIEYRCIHRNRYQVYILFQRINVGWRYQMTSHDWKYLWQLYLCTSLIFMVIRIRKGHTQLNIFILTRFDIRTSPWWKGKLFVIQSFASFSNLSLINWKSEHVIDWYHRPVPIFVAEWNHSWKHYSGRLGNCDARWPVFC